MYYVAGPKAQAEYTAFNTRPRQRLASTPAPSLDVNHPAADEALTTQCPAVDTAPTTAHHVVDDALTTDACALVQHFHQRFHGTSAVVPTTAKALAQAQDLITRYGVDQARHVVEFSVTAAQETDYHPQTLSGILQYTARALADYEQAQQRRAAAARERDEQRRAQEDEQRRRQYEAYRTARLAHLWATLPPTERAAVEQAAAAHVEREHPGPFGRDLLRRIARDDALAAQAQLPSFAEWQATQEQS